jgi:hypothetical protein
MLHALVWCLVEYNLTRGAGRQEVIRRHRSCGWLHQHRGFDFGPCGPGALAGRARSPRPSTMMPWIILVFVLLHRSVIMLVWNLRIYSTNILYYRTICAICSPSLHVWISAYFIEHLLQ